MSTQSYAASVQGVSIRVTKLDENGNLLTGDMDSYTTSAFIRISFTPEYEDGEEITEKAADGTVCVSYKAPDTLKRVNMEVAICDPDPELSALMSGGLLLEQDGMSQGWASAQVGEDPSGNGVAVEAWSRAIQNGKPAGIKPYFHWVFPFVKTRLSGDRVIENGLLATTFEGYGIGNINFRSGIDGSWLWPAAADRPYLYARSDYAPSGLRGFYTWTPGTPPTALGGSPGKPASTSVSALGGTANPSGANVPNASDPYPYNDKIPTDPILSVSDYSPTASPSGLAWPNPAQGNDVNNPSPTGSKQPSVTYLKRGDAVYSITAATPGAVYTTTDLATVSSIIASDASNAGKLSGLGFAPSKGVGGTAAAWTTGTFMTVNGFKFSWDGSNWVAGAAK